MQLENLDFSKANKREYKLDHVNKRNGAIKSLSRRYLLLLLAKPKVLLSAKDEETNF